MRENVIFLNTFSNFNLLYLIVVIFFVNFVHMNVQKFRYIKKKCSFPACGAAVKLHFIVPRRAAEKTPDPGRGSAPQTSHRALRPLNPLPLFRQYQVCYDKDVILPRMCTNAVQLRGFSTRREFYGNVYHTYMEGISGVPHRF